jgi:hypothetical protein
MATPTAGLEPRAAKLRNERRCARRPCTLNHVTVHSYRISARSRDSECTIVVRSVVHGLLVRWVTGLCGGRMEAEAFMQLQQLRSRHTYTSSARVADSDTATRLAQAQSRSPPPCIHVEECTGSHALTYT